MREPKSLDNLTIWQDSIAYVKKIYVLTGIFPDDEKGNLVSSMRKAAIMIPVGIAKATSASSRSKEDLLAETHGILKELLAYLAVSLELNYITEEDLEQHQEIINDLSAGLRNLKNKLSRT